MEQQLITDSWLLVSAEGFRQQQAGRAPALLVKELLQNSLDASPASIDFTIEHMPSEDCVRVVCDDMGEGVKDFEKMRTVFWTSKTDSHHKRGRMGRGFKELLVLARGATVESNGRIIKFAHNEEGASVVETTNGDRRVLRWCSLGRRKMQRILLRISSVCWSRKELNLRLTGN
jgi:hypothetical protein